MTAKNDIDLVLQAQQGDKEAFGLLIMRHEGQVKGLALSMVGNIYLAQELSQEALLHAYLSLSTLREPSKFKKLAIWSYA